MKSKKRTVLSEFIRNALYRMDESMRMIRISLEQLKEEDVWLRPNESSNSIGNLILHLCGNIRQYAIASLSEIPDTRDRDKEFSVREGEGRQELLSLLSETVEEARAVILSCDEAALLKERKVQGFTFSGIGIIIHVSEHLSYHTGQIAFWTKQLKNKDLGFYNQVDLNIKNENRT